MIFGTNFNEIYNDFENLHLAEKKLKKINLKIAIFDFFVKKNEEKIRFKYSQITTQDEIYLKKISDEIANLEAENTKFYAKIAKLSAKSKKLSFFCENFIDKKYLGIKNEKTAKL